MLNDTDLCAGDGEIYHLLNENVIFGSSQSPHRRRQGDKSGVCVCVTVYSGPHSVPNDSDKHIYENRTTPEVKKMAQNETNPQPATSTTTAAAQTTPRKSQFVCVAQKHEKQ